MSSCGSFLNCACFFFILPLLLLAPRWLLGTSLWAICSPMTGEREGEGEEKEGLRARASRGAEQMLSGAQEAGAR